MDFNTIATGQAVCVNLAAVGRSCQHSLSLLTCAVALITYIDKKTQQPHLLVCHLNAGVFHPDGKTQADKAVAQLLDKVVPGSVELRYWGSDGVLKGNNAAIDIPAIKKACGLTPESKCDVVEEVGNVIVTVTPRMTSAFCCAKTKSKRVELHSPKVGASREAKSLSSSGLFSSKALAEHRARQERLQQSEHNKQRCSGCTLM